MFGWVDDVELEEIKMDKPLSTQKSTRWKIFLGFNIVVLCLFWFGILTDYSWYDDLVSLSFSVLVLCVSAITFFMLSFLKKLQLLSIFLICAMSFLFALASILLHRYHSHQTPVQVEFSPDGARFVSLYCSTDNGHGGMDHIEIIVRTKKIPFLQRDLGLYNNLPSRACIFDVNSPVQWMNNNTIYVTEREAYLPVDFIKWEGVLADPGEINGSN